jgi:transposase InsO family protein
MLHAALLLLMLEAVNTDLVLIISLKRSTPNLQLSTSSGRLPHLGEFPRPRWRSARPGPNKLVGDSYDNALAETINGLYKAEVIHRRGPWRSFEVVEFATLEWVAWFNHRRLIEPIGNIPPAEAEERYYARLEQPAMAA